jgi:glucose-1-phosphate thymidylyltransferase
MVYYPLSVLFIAGIREVLVICTPKDIATYQRVLGDGSQWGVSLFYKIQDQPNGLAEAFLIGEEFIGQDSVCLILGDNIFYGLNFSKQLESIVERTKLDAKATIFGYTVKDPQYYGVIEFNDHGEPLAIEEKPTNPKGNQAVVGLYFYPNRVVELAKKIKPSKRGELEITTVNQLFLEQQSLHVETLGEGFAWLDTGTHESLLEASQFIETIEKRQGLKIACLEEVAYQKGYITQDQLLQQAASLQGSTYGDYLLGRYS